MPLLNVNRLTKYYGADLILSSLTFQVSRGEKVALVGANGAGKSTLVKIIAGLEQVDEGTMSVERGTRVAYLAQEEHFGGERTLWQEMEAALAHLYRLHEEIRSLEHRLQDTGAPDWEDCMERYGEMTARFEHADGYHVEQNIERTLHGLGFVEEQYSQPLSHFSGGQKTRAALAATLLSDPDLLLLDEPTNHLDLEAMEWLEGFLKGWGGTLMVISHDRRFLDKVTDRTIELAFAGLEDYPAGYNRYLDLKAERLERRMKEYAAQQEFIARTEEFVRRYKAGQRSREAKGREKRLDRLKEQSLIARPRKPAELKLFLDSQLRSGDLVLSLDKLEVGYPQRGEKGLAGPPKVILQADGLELYRGQRVAIMGPNGSGKTTLLRTIVGELLALQGQARVGYSVAIGYYAQGHDGLDAGATVLDEILHVDPYLGEARARNLLGRFLFSGDDVFKRVDDLSGGERSRLALAQLTLQTNNALVMDEPTNHLDIEAREALESVLKDYAGSILFVSHDRYFVDSLADKLWMIEDGRLVEHVGNYTDYVAQLERERRLAATERSGSSPRRRGRNGASPGDSRPVDEEKQQQKRLAALEAEVERIEREMAQLRSELEAATTAQDMERITALGLRYAELEEEHSLRYEDWVTLAG